MPIYKIREKVKSYVYVTYEVDCETKDEALEIIEDEGDGDERVVMVSETAGEVLSVVSTEIIAIDGELVKKED